MRTVRFIGAGGGVGTTTAALAYGRLAAEAAGRSSSVVVASDDWDGLAGLAGLDSTGAGASSGAIELGGGLVLGDAGRRGWGRRAIELLVIDGGSVRHPGAAELLDGLTVLVLRGPSFGGLRAALRWMGEGGAPAGVVLVAEPGRSLGEGEAVSVLGVPVLVRVELDAAVARCGDAGVMCAPVSRSLRSLLKLDRLVSA
jgi:hypothetical protein